MSNTMTTMGQKIEFLNKIEEWNFVQKFKLLAHSGHSNLHKSLIYHDINHYDSKYVKF
jgi:hypothetical protein